MKRGAGLPVMLLATLLAAACALLATAGLREWRENRMVEAARRDAVKMIGAIGKYETLYNRLPERPRDLQRVGYHEGGGILVCRFEPGAGTVDVELKHKRAQAGVWARFPHTRDAAIKVNIPDC
jgi:hypothetical protein